MAWGQLKLHGGDFRGEASFQGRAFYLFDPRKSKRESIGIAHVAQLEVASEENVQRLGGAVGWGLTGAAVLGPVGLMAGLLAGGRSKDVTFVCVFKDGRKLLATASAKDYTRILGAQMDLLPSPPVPSNPSAATLWPQRHIQDVPEWTMSAVCPHCGCDHEWSYRAPKEFTKPAKPKELLCKDCLRKHNDERAGGAAGGAVSGSAWIWVGVGITVLFCIAVLE